MALLPVQLKQRSRRGTVPGLANRARELVGLAAIRPDVARSTLLPLDEERREVDDGFEPLAAIVGLELGVAHF